jgi:hypothetical protein
MTRRVELTMVGGAILVTAIAMTYPLVSRATGALPANLGDPLLNTFILGWDADRILHGFRGLWNAPFFFPETWTLAFSEHLLGIAFLTAPLLWLTGNPVLVYNVAFLGSYVLSGVGMYLLALTLWGRRDAAWVAAFAFAFAPHRVMYAAQIQLLMSGWMPLGLWGLHRYFETGRRRALTVFVIAYILLALSNGYFLYFFAVPVVCAVAVEFARRWVWRRGDVAGVRWPRVLADLVLAAAAILAAIAPVVVAYLRMRHLYGLRRSLEEIAGYGGQLRDYVRIPPGLRVWDGILHQGEPERMLFPGITVIVLAIVAIGSVFVTRWARPGSQTGRWQWQTGLYMTVLLLAVWLGCGPAVPGPYALLVQLLPGFDGLRVPPRLIVVVALALAVLASAGAASILGRLRPRAAALVTGLMTLAIVAEGYAGPMHMAAFSPREGARRAVDVWLRIGPPGGVLELPIAGPGLAPFTLGYQFRTLAHGHPIINGYSGWGYALQDFLGGPTSPFHTPAEIGDVLVGLRALGVRYVVLHEDLFPEPVPGRAFDPSVITGAILSASDQLAGQYKAGTSWIWRLADLPANPAIDNRALVQIPTSAFAATASTMPDRVPLAFDGKMETRWSSEAPQGGGEWVRIVLDREYNLARVKLDIARDIAGDYPRILVVESEGAGGGRETIFNGPTLPALIQGMALPGPVLSIAIDLPANRTRVIWLRQAGKAHPWYWSVSEIRVWARP